MKKLFAFLALMSFNAFALTGPGYITCQNFNGGYVQTGDGDIINQIHAEGFTKVDLNTWLFVYNEKVHFITAAICSIKLDK